MEFSSEMVRKRKFPRKVGATISAGELPKVLVVDAHPLTRVGIVSLFQHQSTFTVCGETGEAAVAKRLCQETQPHCILFDPHSHADLGLDLAEEFLRLHSPVTLMIISDAEDAYSLDRAFHAGARGYISKRDDPAAILAGLRILLEGSLYTSPRVSSQLLRHFAGGLPTTDAHGFDKLSPREHEIFHRIGAGQSSGSMAHELSISIKTVETYRQRIKEKLHLPSGEKLLDAARAWGREKGFSSAFALLIGMAVFLVEQVDLFSQIIWMFFISMDWPEVLGVTLLRL